jgi:2-keto-4-pentenoate hydratase/2-oxohepta-3-ene-1,7-dioic acid hydratase in catechol pathway
MKICRYKKGDNIALGIIDGDQIFECDDSLTKKEWQHSREDVEILAPVTPSKVVCVGRNYADHAKELGNDVPSAPLLFLKAPSSIVASGQSIILPSQSSRVEHEAELAIVIARTCKNLHERSDPLSYVLGYTCLNDVTARDLQRTDVQFTRAKSFDSFCPIGPFIETELDPGDVSVTCRVRDEVRQQGRTSQMIFSVPFLITYISRHMTLNAGDVIATGTPAGVSQLNDGDTCEVEIEGIGVLSNPVMSVSELS